MEIITEIVKFILLLGCDSALTEASPPKSTVSNSGQVDPVLTPSSVSNSGLLFKFLDLFFK